MSSSSLVGRRRIRRDLSKQVHNFRIASRPAAGGQPTASALRSNFTASNSFVEPLEDGFQLTAAMEHSDQLDAICHRAVDDRVMLEVVPPQLRVKSFSAPTEDEGGVRQLLTFSFDSIDEAVGVGQAILSDVEPISRRSRSAAGNFLTVPITLARPCEPVPLRGCFFSAPRSPWALPARSQAASRSPF